MSKQITRAAAVAAITALAAGLTTAPAVAAPKKPKVSIADTTITVTEGGVATVTLTVNKKSKKKVKLNWSTQARPKSAKAGTDFVAVKKGRVVLQPGETTATLPVAIPDDTLAEGDEVFFIKFNGKAVKVKRPKVRVTIVDNDGPAVTPAG